MPHAPATSLHIYVTLTGTFLVDAAAVYIQKYKLLSSLYFGI
jgi:hypothetical protein